MISILDMLSTGSFVCLAFISYILLTSINPRYHHWFNKYLLNSICNLVLVHKNTYEVCTRLPQRPPKEFLCIIFPRWDLMAGAAKYLSHLIFCLYKPWLQKLFTTVKICGLAVLLVWLPCCKCSIVLIVEFILENCGLALITSLKWQNFGQNWFIFPSTRA